MDQISEKSSPHVPVPPEAFNFSAHLLALNSSRGTKAAFVDNRGTLSYGDLEDRVRRIASALRDLGIKREERVLLAMQDCTDWPAAFLGAIYAGIVPVAVNTLLTADDYAYMLEHSRAQAVLTSGDVLPAIKGALTKSDHEVRKVIVSHPIASLDFGEIALETVVETQAPMARPARTHCDDPAFWLYSSGSTGMPKGVRHLHGNLAATAETYAKQVLGIRESDVCFSAAKLFFAYGLGNALTFPLSVGATTILNSERPTPALMFKLLNRYNPTIFYGVPTLFAAMLHDESLRHETAGSGLRICTSAGEALPESVGHAWKARFGVDILDGVGSTELLHIFLSNAPGDIKYGSSGRPVPGYQVRLVNEAGLDVPDGEIGEMLVHAPSAGEGYWNQRHKTRATFEGYWTRTGDKYVRDAEGRYTFCGRSDDMFKVSGIWVSPFEVESALMTHPSVLEAAVVPEADPEGLLKPKAYVVLRPSVDRETLHEALKEHVKQKIGPWKYPRWIEVVDALPKTATGKIQRFKLREGAGS
ncbi:MAG: benzoate-CoA ligase family protein [Bradyrhizobium sp.]|nr:benzoate-CoA ligase family protein [Bradyrhizobium sp.]